jgi:hypothetical protein
MAFNNAEAGIDISLPGSPLSQADERIVLRKVKERNVIVYKPVYFAAYL